jgi:hypothetical protein
MFIYTYFKVIFEAIYSLSSFLLSLAAVWSHHVLTLQRNPLQTNATKHSHKYFHEWIIVLIQGLQVFCLVYPW